MTAFGTFARKARAAGVDAHPVMKKKRPRIRGRCVRSRVELLLPESLSIRDFAISQRGKSWLRLCNCEREARRPLRLTLDSPSRGRRMGSSTRKINLHRDLTVEEQEAINA